MTNCTVWRTSREAITIYAGDDVPFTPGPVIRINHCTFDDCGYTGYSVISADEVDDTQIKNCIISNAPAAAAELFGVTATVSHSDIYNSGNLQLNRGASAGSGMMFVDPQYANASAGDFTLAQTSPLWFQADDGSAMGDLYWATNPPTVIESPSIREPGSFDLINISPNPFNPSTRITFELPAGGRVKIYIYDAGGALVGKLLDRIMAAGRHTIKWRAKGRASGLYFAVVKFGRLVYRHKMLLIK